MRSHSLVASGLATFLLAFAACSTSGAGSAALQPLAAVGTYDRTELLVAFYRSQIHADAMEILYRQRAAAEAAGDRARVAAIEEQGSALQEHAHAQLAGDAPLDNVLAALQPHWQRVADEAGVSGIVEQGTAPSDAKTIDVTPRLVALLAPAKR